MANLDLFKGFTPEEVKILIEMNNYRPGTYKRTDEHRRLMGSIFAGRSYGPQTKEHKDRKLRALWGRKRSSSSIIRMSEAQAGRLHSPEHRRKNSEGLMGHPVSIETRGKISRALTGRVVSGATRKKQSEAHMGKVVSGETGRRISEALMGHPVSVEHRRKTSRSHKAFWAGLSDTEYAKRVSRLGITSSPTEPERQLGLYLDERFPGKWIYNGNGQFLAGLRKRPDFVRSDGTKEVIEVFGMYWHPLSDVKKYRDHYAHWGYSCTIIWEWCCYLWGELDEMFEWKEV